MKLRAALVVLLLIAGCRQPPAVAPGDLEPLAHPDLAAIEEAARRQLEEARSRLDALLSRGGEARELAGAFGGLGELYHAYQILPSAAACYRNAATLDPESFLWPYYLGAVLQRSGDFDSALASLERAAELRSDDGPTLRRLGEVELERGDPAAAESHFRALLDAGPSFAAAARFGLGRAALARGDARSAVEQLEKVLELQPAAGIVHHSLGMALRLEGRAEEAAEQLEKKGGGEVESPDRLIERVDSLAISSGAYLRRGNRALVNGRLAEASGFFRQAIEADPESIEARRNLAIARLRGGDVDGALDQLRQAAESAPENAWVQFDLGNAYLQKGLAEQGIASFRRSVELAPDFVSAHFNLANALIGSERWVEARPHLEAVLEHEPGDSRARYLRAMARHRAGETAAALADLEALVAEEPLNLVARQGLAAIFTETWKPEQAAAVYERGLELDLPAADKLRLHFQLAELHWRSGKRRRAIREWRRAVELDPESSAAHTALANGLQLLDERGEAREHFARAVELDPKNATAWLSEASLWILDGEFDAAHRRLEAALQHNPDHPGLTHTLARLLATCSDSSIRDGRRALELARIAFSLESSLDHAETVAMALAELGHFEEAIKWQQGLAQRAALSGDQAVMRRLMTRLQLYQRRQPVRAVP